MRVIPTKSSASPSTEDLWRARIEAWRLSGLSPEIFCADKPYAAGTLRWWSSRLRRASDMSFVELRPRSAAAASPPTELVVEVGAARVRVPTGFDPTHLASIVAALAGGAR